MVSQYSIRGIVAYPFYAPAKNASEEQFILTRFRPSFQQFIALNNRQATVQFSCPSEIPRHFDTEGGKWCTIMGGTPLSEYANVCLPPSTL
jgi:hypothetical protein